MARQETSFSMPSKEASCYISTTYLFFEMNLILKSHCEKHNKTKNQAITMISYWLYLLERNWKCKKSVLESVDACVL